ncbi:hypothetical protein [Sphingomonas sp. Leaf242]|uniref:hypothetical protein n=1 Tax=Sphingomonas sp. Leaf242 TaxID=1736304 RepID=UPI000AE60683|nr:hypothetical protein [Sphingomonas sp. Leaf242]
MTGPTARAMPGQRSQANAQAAVVDLKHVVRTWTDKQVALGKTTLRKSNEFWQKHGHDYLENIKSYFPIGKDVREGGATVRLIIAELGIGGQYILKTYRGRQHVVFKGYAGARQFLTGPRYGLMHPKIISLKMTKAGMKAAARDSVIFGILFCTVIDVVDYVSNDRATLGSLFGAIGMDIAKCLVATAAAYAVGVGTAALMGTAVIAVGPVVAALVIGVGVSLALDWIDNRLGLTRKLGQLCDEGLARLKAAVAESEATWRRIESSQVVRDLSREAGEWSDWIANQASRVTWTPGFL